VEERKGFLASGESSPIDTPELDTPPAEPVD